MLKTLCFLWHEHMHVFIQQDTHTTHMKTCIIFLKSDCTEAHTFTKLFCHFYFLLCRVDVFPLFPCFKAWNTNTWNRNVFFFGFSHCKCKKHYHIKMLKNALTVALYDMLWYAPCRKEKCSKLHFLRGIAYKQCINGILWRFLYT